MSLVENRHKIVQPWFVYGFLYWAGFLMVLEPDNVVRAIRAGHQLSFGHEAVRITGAALVGAAVTPVLLLMTKRFPMSGEIRWRNALVQLGGAAFLAFGLIITSCILAAWAFERRWMPSMANVRYDLVSNWALLVFALAFFSVIAQTIRFSRVSSGSYSSPLRTDFPDRVPVKSRGRTSFVEISSIDWIETQGNYLALHVGTRQHLIRDTLANFEARLDARHFVRIHRRAIVATTRIKDIRAEGNGDATLRLIDGCELRVSRRFRRTVRESWASFPK
jgi:LytTr DNA-binding domain